MGDLARPRHRRRRPTSLFANGASLKWIAVTPAKWSSFDQLGAHFAANWPRYLAQFVAWLAVFSVALDGARPSGRASSFPPSSSSMCSRSLIFVVRPMGHGQLLQSRAAAGRAAARPRHLEPRSACRAGSTPASASSSTSRPASCCSGATLPFTLIVWAGPVAILQASIVSIVTFLVIFCVGARARARPAARRDARAPAARSAASRPRSPSPARSARRRSDAPIAITAGDPLGDRDDLRAAASSRARCTCRPASPAPGSARRNSPTRPASPRRRPMAASPARRRASPAPPIRRVWAFTLMKVVGRDVWIGIWAFVLAIIATTRWEPTETGRKPEAARDLVALSEIRDRLPRRLADRHAASTRGYSLADYNKTRRAGPRRRRSRICAPGPSSSASSASASPRASASLPRRAASRSSPSARASSSTWCSASSCRPRSSPRIGPISASEELDERDTMTGRCRACAHFRNDPAYLEAIFPGMSAMSSAWGSTRAEDGLCLKHDRYLSADAGCARLHAASGSGSSRCRRGGRVSRSSVPISSASNASVIPALRPGI